MPLDNFSNSIRNCASIKLSGLIAHNTGIPADNMRVLGKYALVYLIKGEGEYTDERGLKVPVKDGSLILVFPDIAHAYGPLPGKRWKEFFIVFSGSIFDSWRKDGLLSPEKPVIDLSPVDYWEKRIQSIPERGFGASGFSSSDESLRLQSFLADALLFEATASGNNRQGWLAQAQALLAEKATDKHAIHATAQAMGESYESFRKKFASYAKQSPGAYQQATLMEKAKYMLSHTDQTVTAISEALGYCDPFHFSRRFRKLVGLSPTQYRAHFTRMLQRVYE